MEGLRLEQISKTYGDKKVLDRVCLTVAQGEFCILLGPSGCGKTTLLRIIAGLVRQDTGSIHIDTREVSALEPRDRDVAMVFQSYALYPHLRVYENMAFPLRLKKADRRDIDAQVRQAARMLGIEQLLDRKPAELSGGQRQRVAIGRALVRNPKLFLFDEPLSNLDAQLRTSMRVELARLHRKLNKTIVYVTHDQTEAMTLGQKVVVFDRGTIQQIGTPQEIYARPVNLFVASFIGNPSINIISGRLERDSRGLHFHTGELHLPLVAREELAPFAGREMSIGIRPEALQPGAGPFTGRVEHVENLGSERIVHLRTGQHLLVSRLFCASHRVSCGDSLSLCTDPGEIHFFHRGVRVGQNDAS